MLYKDERTLTTRHACPAFWRCSLSCQKEKGTHGTTSAERHVGKWCCLRALCRPLESVGRPRVFSLARDPPSSPLARSWVRDRCAQPNHSRRGIASRNHGY